MPGSGEWASDLAAVDDDESEGCVDGEEADEVCDFAVAVGESCAFEGDLDQDEIQLIALYMKHEWIKRCVASWENIRQLYAD